MKIILGSGSPRRRELIGLLGLTVVARAADVDEESVVGVTPALDALETARLKVQTIVEELVAEGETDFVVIGSDTNVALGERLLQKPADSAEATQMLRDLRGRVHQVHTAIVVKRWDGVMAEDVSINNALMRNYSDEEIADYVASGDPLDKAGGYAIHHPVFAPIERLDGCFAGVMGLSLCMTARLLRTVGVAVNDVVPSHCAGSCFRQADYDPSYGEALCSQAAEGPRGEEEKMRKDVE